MTMRSRLAAVATGVTMILAASLGFASSASAAFDPGRVVGPTGWTPDGAVHSVLVSEDGDHVYVGGTFSGGVVALSAATGALEWTGAANGDVRALAEANGGSHLVIGGAFTAVSGATHRKLALLSTDDGTADAKWRATAGGTVRDIVVRGSTAYFGGGFANHNGVTQANLGAVSTNAGQKAVADTSFTASTNGNVYSLALYGSRVIFGGRFTTVSGTGAAGPRRQLASFNTVTNTVDGWAPTAACTNCNLYWDLVVNGTTVYTASRNAGAVTAVDLGTGIKLWRANANGDAQALTFVAGPTPRLYAGGHFTTVRGQPRTIVAELNPSNGALEAFSARFVTTYPGVWALASTSSRLCVGGHFTAAGPKVNNRNLYPYFAMFGN